MPQQYDPYDPEEIERRRALLMNDTGDDDAAIMAHDEEEIPDSQTEALAPTVGTYTPAAATPSAANPRGPAPMTAAQQHYQQTLSQMPNQQDFRPTKGRRWMAAIAGGLAGASDGAKAGVETAHGLLSSPYNRAMSNWQSAMGREAEGMKLEGTVQKQDIDRQRADNYGRNAEARMIAAKATERFRQTQADRLPTHEQRMEEIHAQHPLTPPKPSTFQEQVTLLKENPEAAKLWHDTFKPFAPPNPNQSTAAERAQARNQAEAGRNARHASSIAARVPPIAAPKQQQDAENVAVQRLIRRDPKYAAFWKPPSDEVVGNRTVRNPGRILGAHELPQPGTQGGFMGIGGTTTTDAQASLARTKYSQFLTELEKEKQAILGGKAPASKGRYTLTQEEE